MKKTIIALTVALPFLWGAGCASIPTSSQPAQPIGEPLTPSDSIQGQQKPIIGEEKEKNLPQAEEPAEPEEQSGILYRNAKFGFKITLTDGYAGYTIKEVEYPNAQNDSFTGTSLSFEVDASNTNWVSNKFGVFEIKAIPLDWKNAYTTIGEDGILVVTALKDSPAGYLGHFLGQNSSYAFVYSRGQDCPGLTPEDVTFNSPQCMLMKQVPELIKSFEAFDS